MKFSQKTLACLLLVACTDAFLLPKKLQQKPLQPTRSLEIPVGTTKLQAASMDMNGALQTASAATSAITSSPLFKYFLQTLISYAVPTFFLLVTIFFAASAFKNKDDPEDNFMDGGSAISELFSDLYGEGPKKGKMPDFSFGKPKKSQLKNLGIPSQEYIKITSINEKYDAYDYSIEAATKSKAAAAAGYRSKSFDRALQLALKGETELPSYAKANLLIAEKKFLKNGKKVMERLQFLEGFLTRDALDKEFERLGMEKDFQLDPEPSQKVNGNATSTSNETSVSKESPKRESSTSRSQLLQEVSKLQREAKQMELEFIEDLVASVGPERAYAMRSAILGDIAGRGAGGLLASLEDRPLSAMLNGSTSEQNSLFVMQFPGDVTASQLNGLREEVTAVIRNAKPGDEVLVVLQSGGGTVTGYGLAAGQLVRLKEKGIFLTIAVEQVAASGGYMMTCVADKIVASPFAVLGSIGVISEIPNVYERLKEEGM